MLLDIITLVGIITAQNDIAARQLLLELASNHDEDYSKLVILKSVSLLDQPAIGKQWLANLY